MATMNPQHQYLVDADTRIRVDDGTDFTTDTIMWIDVGKGAPPNSTAATSAQRREYKLVVDFGALSSDASTKSLQIEHILAHAEDGSNAGQGDLADGATVVLPIINFDDGTAGQDVSSVTSGRCVFPLENFYFDAHYRFIGIRFNFTGVLVDAEWGAFVSMC